MPQLASPLSTPAGMPAVNQAHLGKLVGVQIAFPTFAAFTAAITTGQTGFSMDQWFTGQRYTIAGEPIQAVRFYDGTSPLNAMIGNKVFSLNNNSTTIGYTTGAPGSGVGNPHDLLLDQATGLVYSKINSGAWDTGTFAYAVTSSSSSTPVPVNTAAPVVSGTAQVGQTLSVTTGTWTNTPVSYTYQWARNGTTTTGATSNTYVPVTADIGSSLGCRVIASNAGGSSAVANSNATANVIAASVAAHRYLRFQVDASNGATVSLYAVTLNTADGVDRASGVAYTNINADDNPHGTNVLTNGHTNASTWFTGTPPGSATFDLTTPQAIDHITVNVGNAPVTNANLLPTALSLYASDDNATFTLLKAWTGITTTDWGTDGASIIRTFSVV